jgi:hypothetical protein
MEKTTSKPWANQLGVAGGRVAPGFPLETGGRTVSAAGILASARLQAA